MTEYKLVCVDCGKTVPENYTLSCPNGCKSLIRAEYSSRQLHLRNCNNVFKFGDWLPIGKTYDCNTGTVVFQNDDLSKELGLNDLWIAFTGYYPERGAMAVSGSFKELEALPTFSRLERCTKDTVVIASAGNTGRAFAEIGNRIGRRCVVVVPETSSDRITVVNDNGMTKVIAVEGDYANSIAIADRIATMEGYVSEGGAKNVARRDGMGTVMLEGAFAMKGLPGRYFQAVGSGTGGIASWEASMRLISDGRFGNKMPRLDLAQNLPFIPMVKAWNAGRRELLEEDMGDASKDIGKIYADVLSNRKPPYSPAGGVYDAMKATGGEFHSITNEDAKKAEKLWLSFEDVKPDPAASVALASLNTAAVNRRIDKDERVLLNMTGGGIDRARKEIGMTTLTPSAHLASNATDEEIKEALNARRGSNRSTESSRNIIGCQSAVRQEQRLQRFAA